MLQNLKRNSEMTILGDITKKRAMTRRGDMTNDQTGRHDEKKAPKPIPRSLRIASQA